MIHLRSGMLLARRRPERQALGVLGLGIVAWLAGLVTLCLGGPWVLCGALGLAGVGGLLIGPLLALQAEWLSVDLERGWIYWRRRSPNLEQQDSFSPQRLEGLKLTRHGCAARGPHWTTLELRLDHPRLKRLRLGLWLDDARAEKMARRAAAALELAWEDTAGMRHAAEPRAVGKLQTHDCEIGPTLAPPEIELAGSARGVLVLLPNFARLQDGSGLLLFYALVWNLWAWSCLVYEAIHYGPLVRWEADEMLVVGLLLGVSFAGLAMLHGALMRLLGRQGLRWNGTAWEATRRWLGINWGWKTLELRSGSWLRRVDPPCPDAGLWVPTPAGEVQLGNDLSPEGLAWLERTMLWPQAEQMGAPPLTGEAQRGFAL